MDTPKDRTSRTINQYEQIASAYAQNIADRAPQKELEKFISQIPSGGKILDVGSAAGRDTRIFYDKGFDVCGIDLSQELIAIARRQNPGIDFFFADVRQLPFSDNIFDGIWSNAVFEHLDKIEMVQSLDEWKRVLKKGGLLYLRTKMGSGSIKISDELSQGQEREFTLLSEEELKKMIQDSGLNLSESYQTKDETRDLTWINTFSKK